MPPSTAILLGDIPYSIKRKLMAASAIQFTIIVNTDKLNNITKLNLLFAFFAASATENKIKAITPINKTLNSKSKLRSW